MTRSPYQRQQETCALQRLREAADLGKWQRAGDHEKEGRVSRWAVRNSHSTWTSDGFLRLAPSILEARVHSPGREQNAFSGESD